MASLTVSPTDKSATKTTTKKSHKVSRALDFTDELPPEQVNKYRSDASVAVAAALRVSDESRFQQYENYIRNMDDKLSHEILRTFNPKKHTKGDALAWMSTNIGTLPDDAGTKLTLKQCADVSLVAVALAKYGSSTLNELHEVKKLDSWKKVSTQSYEARNERKQNQYRDQSRSTLKSCKQVAHYAGLDVVFKLNADLPPQHRVAVADLETVLNDFANFRMVLRSTNQQGGLHANVDALFLHAHQGVVDKQLTAQERERVLKIVQFYQSDHFQQEMIERGGEQLYAKIRNVVNKLDTATPLANRGKLWDGRKDKRSLQSPSVSATLKSDGTPDRRFKVNQVLSRQDLEGKESAAPPAPTAVRLKKDGTPDRRSRAAKSEEPSTATTARSQASSQRQPPPPLAKASAVHVKADDTPDRRYAENKAPPPPPAMASVVHVKADGTPDRRYAGNRAQSPAAATIAPTPTYSGSSCSSSSSSASRSSGGGEGRVMHTGPRGGTYYVSSGGNKVYSK